MIAHAPVRARRRSVALAALLALASSAPVVAQTQLYLLTSGADEIIWDPDCQPWDYDPECGYTVIPHPGRVIHLDVDRRQIVATTTVSHALGASIGPRITPDGRFLLWSGSVSSKLRRRITSACSTSPAGSKPPCLPPAACPPCR